MKFKHILVLALSVASFAVSAQLKKGIEYSGFFDTYYWKGPVSFTGGLGIGAYSGDLCSDFSCIKLKPHYSFGLAYKIWPRVFIGGELSIFKLGAVDKSPLRGFEFTSKNTEIAAYTDFYLREDIVKRHNDLYIKHKLFKPYLSLGLSLMKYNVTVNADETNFPRYSLFIPFGGGAFFDITHRLGVKVEGIYHIGFTDYLDGVSQLASPDKNDGYGTVRVKLVYTPKAKRMKPKQRKLSEEDIQNIKNTMAIDTNKSAPKTVVPLDPEEKDPYYQDEKKEDATGKDQNKDILKPEENSETPATDGFDW